MLEVIASVFSISSLIAILYMIGNKIPTLSGLDITGYPQNLREAVEMAKSYTQNSKQVQTALSPDMYLQRILSQGRIITLKLENKLNQWLVESRKRSQERRDQFPDGYWGDVRNEAKDEPPRRKRHQL